MYMSVENLLIVLVAGLVCGWLADQIVQGARFGMVGDLVIGVVGAFIGTWLLPKIGLTIGTALVAWSINAVIGALVLLLIARLVHDAGTWQRHHWGRHS